MPVHTLCHRTYKGVLKGSGSPAIPNYPSHPQDCTRQHGEEQGLSETTLSDGQPWPCHASPVPSTTAQLETELFQHLSTSPGQVARDGRGLQPPKIIQWTKDDLVWAWPCRTKLPLLGLVFRTPDHFQRLLSQRTSGAQCREGYMQFKFSFSENLPAPSNRCSFTNRKTSLCKSKYCGFNHSIQSIYKLGLLFSANCEAVDLSYFPR